MLGIFNEILDGPGRLLKLLREADGLASAAREEIRQAVLDTYALMINALSTVETRLTEAALIPDDDAFVEAVRRLCSTDDWHNLERAVGLCTPLRDVHGKIMGLVAKQDHYASNSADWAAVAKMADMILSRELHLASFIADGLAEATEGVMGIDPQSPGQTDDIARLRDRIHEIRREAQAKRRQLCADERDALDLFNQPG
ncbi:MAG: hypothetical protein AAFR17_13400 [Pseudomonadota bacterium]